MSTPTATDRFLQHDGARLRWRLEGAGPAIVLLHGWALDLAYWDRLVPLLAPRFTVLRFDRRGFGLSEGLPDIHRNVADLAALLRAAGIDRMVLLGMSQGARLALHYVTHHPAQVRGLVLDGAPAFESEPELPLHAYRIKLDSEGPAALRSALLAHPLMHLQDGTNHAALADIVERYRGLDLQHPVAPASPPDIAGIATPALILNGSLDSSGRHDASARLAALLPAARRVQIPGAGHLALLDDPARYAREVLDFCSGIDP